MVQATRRDDGDYVTKGEFREAIAELQEQMRVGFGEIKAGILYNRKLYELILDDIKPNWRDETEGGEHGTGG